MFMGLIIYVGSISLNNIVLQFYIAILYIQYYNFGNFCLSLTDHVILEAGSCLFQTVFFEDFPVLSHSKCVINTFE